MNCSYSEKNAMASHRHKMTGGGGGGGGAANNPYILKAHEPLHDEHLYLVAVLRYWPPEVPGMSFFMPNWTIHISQGLVFSELTIIYQLDLQF